MAEHELNKIVDDDGEVFNLRDSTKQPTADRVTAWGSTPSDTKYPSEKLVKDSLDGKLSYLDATYMRNNATGDGWVKLANVATTTRNTLDIFGVWDVLMTTASGGIWRDSVTLNVRFGSGGSLPTIPLFNRLCEITNKTSQFEICVKVVGLGGSGNTTVELWAKVPKGWYCIGIRESGASGASSLSKKLFWEYHSYTTDGGSSKPVADASNNIQVKDPDIYSRDALIQKVEFTQPAEYKSFVIIEDVTRWYDPAGTAAISKGYQLIGQIAFWRSGGGYESMAVAFIKFHLNYRWQLTNDSCCEVKSTLPNNSFCPMIIRDARDENNVKYYFGLRTKIAWNSTVQFIGRTRDLSFSNLEWIPGENAAHTGNGTEFPVGITIERNCDLLEWNSIANGGTGATTAIGAEYNILNQVADINTTIDGNRKIALCNQTKSASNGVFRWLKLSNVWTWIKGLLSSESGVNISGSSASCTGNAATATELSAGADRTKLDGIAEGAEVNVQSDWNQATTTADDYIKNKPTIPSGTQLVYDCGTGSASTTDFDNALAAFNAGDWVIIHSSGNTYHCVGTYNSGLRFKQIANETASIKVNTLNWTRGSAPSVGTQLEPSMPGHTHSQYVEKAGDTMSGKLTVQNSSATGVEVLHDGGSYNTEIKATRSDTGVSMWTGIGSSGTNHGFYSYPAANGPNSNGWVVVTDDKGLSSYQGKCDGYWSKYFGSPAELRTQKRVKLGVSYETEDTYTRVHASAILEARTHSIGGVSGGTITMLLSVSARGSGSAYYRLHVLSQNGVNLNSVCPVLITKRVSAIVTYVYFAFASSGTSTTLLTLNYTDVRIIPLNGTVKFDWDFAYDDTDYDSTMTMHRPYVSPMSEVGTAVGDANTPVYVKNDGSFGTASGVDVAVALKDAGRGDVAGTSGHIVKVGYDNSSVPATTPSGTSTYAAGATVGTTKSLVTSYRYDGVAFYKDVDSGNVTVGNSQKWNGYNLAIQNPGSTPAADTIYIF